MIRQWEQWEFPAQNLWMILVASATKFPLVFYGWILIESVFLHITFSCTSEMKMKNLHELSYFSRFQMICQIQFSPI